MLLILDNTYFSSHADDNNPYTINQNTDSVTRSLGELPIALLNWFKENKLKVNLNKYYLIVSGTENAEIKLDAFTITIEKRENYLALLNNKIYNLRSRNNFGIPFRNSPYNGNESISCLVQKFGYLCHII